MFIKYCVFLGDFKIFRTLAFLCFPSVSVCVHIPGRYRVFSKNCVFSSKCCDFLNSASSVAIDLPSSGPAWSSMYTHGQQGKPEFRIYLNIFEKTQKLMNTLCVKLCRTVLCWSTCHMLQDPVRMWGWDEVCVAGSKLKDRLQRYKNCNRAVSYFFHAKI